MNSLWFDFGDSALVLRRWEQADIGKLSNWYFDFLHSFTRIICNMYINCNTLAVMIELVDLNEKGDLNYRLNIMFDVTHLFI